MENRRQINPFLVGIVVIGLVVVGILAYVLYEMLRPNSYGPEIKIDNFGQYYGDAPREIKDLVFNNLYGTVADNLSESSEIPTSGAVIRSGKNTYDEKYNMHYANYIVDIEAVGQSYKGYFEWSDDANNPYASGYPIIFTCLPLDQLIYPDFGCKDIFVDSISVKFPITTVLPVMVDYFTDGYAERITYDINYEISDDVITLVVSDYTGGNEARAREKIRELGYDPDGFKIIYKNKVADTLWPHVGDD